MHIVMMLFIIQDQWTPLHIAAWCDHTETVALLVKSGANVNMKDEVSSGALIVKLMLQIVLMVQI